MGATGAAVAAPTLLSGCASGDSDAVRVVVSGNASDRPLWGALVRRFEARHPGITLQPVFVSGPASGNDTWTGFFSTVQTRIVGGQKYDLVYAPTEGQLLFSSRNVLEPLEGYLDRDADAVRDFRSDVDKRVLDQFDAHRPPDGRSYYVPMGENCPCLLINRRLFRQAGVEVPHGEWTWDEFERAAVRIHRTTGSYSIAFSTDLWGFMPWLLTNSAQVLDDTWRKSAIGSGRAREAVEFTRSFVSRGMAPQAGGTFDTYAAIHSGKLAMMNGAFNAIVELRHRGYAMDDYAFVPYPHRTRPASSVGYGAFGMFKVSDKKDAAWQFVKYAMSKECQDYIAKTGFLGVSPVRRSSATGPLTRNNAPSGTSFLYGALANSTPVPGVPEQTRISTPFSQAISQMLTGNMAIGSGLKTLDQQISGGLVS
ncbi:sugar ABC transporter substrate-binding protein [Streptomyces sp. NPDC051322]|uniref:ABC transporter substrate-binding protein n=1 Tax=Streptomyces sp. NPDC051322 TaxID=3154645 RepID=UPI00344B5C7A